MTYELIVALVTFALIAAITPGPNNILLMASGANFGFRRTIPHYFGILFGFMLMVVLVGVGLMRLFSQFPVIYVILKSASVIYLLFLAWKIATAAPFSDDPNAPLKSKPLTFIQASLFQWVNPKAWAVALAAYSGYSSPAHPLEGVLITALAFASVHFIAATTWVLIGTQLRYFLTDPFKLRIFNVSIATVLLITIYPIVFLK